MNFSQLECLVALADTGSFTEAAYAVGLTQSAVSHALATLETELGVTLIERSRKGVVALTPTGEKILLHARTLLTQAEAITQEAKAATGIAAGKLRIGTTTCLSPGLLAKVMTRFHAQYPDVETVLFEGTVDEVEGWLASSIIDIGLVPLPATEMDGTLIATDELCVIVGIDHRLAVRDAVTPAALQNEDFIMSKTDCSFQIMRRAGLELSRSKLPIRYQASDSATILAMVKEGLGVTLFPRLMLPTSLDGLVALPLDPPQQLPIGLAIRSRETASRAAKLFIQTALNGVPMETPMILPAR